MSDPWKPVVTAAGGKPGGVALAQGLFVMVGLVAVLWYISACMTLVGFEDYKEPGRTAAFWRLAGFLVLMAACSLGAAAGLSSRRPRVGWWLGMAGVLAVAVGGVAILSAPRWAAHTDLTPARWACGLLVLLVAGVLLTAVLAPSTRRWVREAPAPLAGSSQPAEVWRVAEPGADLTARPGGTVIVARLAPGTVLAGVKRRGHYIQVTAPDGQSGWVDRRSLH